MEISPEEIEMTLSLYISGLVHELLTDFNDPGYILFEVILLLAMTFEPSKLFHPFSIDKVTHFHDRWHLKKDPYTHRM